MSLYYKALYSTIVSINLDDSDIKCYIPKNGILLYTSNESEIGKAYIKVRSRCVHTTNTTIHALKYLLSSLGYRSMPYPYTKDKRDKECGYNNIRNKLVIERYSSDPTCRLSLLPVNVRVDILSTYMPRYVVYIVKFVRNRYIELCEYDMDTYEHISVTKSRYNGNTLPGAKLGNKLYIISDEKRGNNVYIVYKIDFMKRTINILRVKDLTTPLVSYNYTNEDSSTEEMGNGPIYPVNQTVIYNGYILVYNWRMIRVFNVATMGCTEKKIHFPKKVTIIKSICNINDVLWYYTHDYVNYKLVSCLYKTIDYENGTVEEIVSNIPLDSYISNIITCGKYILMFRFVFPAVIYRYDTEVDVWVSKPLSHIVWNIKYDDIGLFTLTNGPSIYTIDLNGEIHIFDVQRLEFIQTYREIETMVHRMTTISERDMYYEVHAVPV